MSGKIAARLADLEGDLVPAELKLEEQKCLRLGREPLGVDPIGPA